MSRIRIISRLCFVVSNKIHDFVFTFPRNLSRRKKQINRKVSSDSNRLSANPQNGQTHSNNSSALVFDHFVGLALKGLIRNNVVCFEIQNKKFNHAKCSLLLKKNCRKLQILSIPTLTHFKPMFHFYTP